MRTITVDRTQIYEGDLILVNASYGIQTVDSKEMIYINPEDEKTGLNRKAADVLNHIFDKIGSEDNIVPVSGYRTMNEQIEIYKDSLRDHGKSFTEKYVALPNHSEHQTGLAIDLGIKKDSIDFIRPDFPYDGICEKFRQEAVKQGFVERYGKDKEAVTGIAHEPWHFRYVGYPHSEIMSDKNLSLEEYIEYLKNYTYKGEHLRFKNENNMIEIFDVPLDQAENIEISVPDHCVCQVSGNNIDGVIITVWEKKNGKESVYGN